MDGSPGQAGTLRAWRVSLRDTALQRKLLFVSVVTAGVSLLAALLALASYDVAVARPKLVSDLASRIELVSLNLDVDLNFGDRAAATRTLAALRGTPDIHSACLFDAERKVFARYLRDGEGGCAWPAETGGTGYRFAGPYLSMMVPVRFSQETVGYLCLLYTSPSPRDS